VDRVAPDFGGRRVRGRRVPRVPAALVGHVACRIGHEERVTLVALFLDEPGALGGQLHRGLGRLNSDKAAMTTAAEPMSRTGWAWTKLTSPRPPRVAVKRPSPR